MIVFDSKFQAFSQPAKPTGVPGRQLILNLAGVGFKIDPVNRSQLALCFAGYEDLPEYTGNTPGTADGARISAVNTPIVSLGIRPEEIREEKALFLRHWQEKGAEIPFIDDYWHEINALRRKMLTVLIEHQIIQLHGSAICVDGQGVLFTAPSGTGKSTHSRLWRERFGKEVIMINDDKPLVRVTEDGILICGAPWNGKHRLGRQIAAPLRAVVRLRRGEANEISPLDNAGAFRELFLQTYQFRDREKMQRVISVLARIIEDVPCYSLHCNMEPEAAEVAREGLRGI